MTPKFLRSAAALVLLTLGGTAAQAQIAGAYGGMTSEGYYFTLTVDQARNGEPRLRGVSTAWTATCAASGKPVYTNWQVGTTRRINIGDSRFVYAEDQLQERVYLSFSPDSQTVTGTFEAKTAVFTDPETGPEACSSPVLTFTATYRGPAQAIPEQGTLFTYTR